MSNPPTYAELLDWWKREKTAEGKLATLRARLERFLFGGVDQDDEIKELHRKVSATHDHVVGLHGQLAELLRELDQLRQKAKF